LNEIVFPAGILQPPVFDPSVDDALNYGATGATIGHEISHGFDDEGSQYDSDGNLRDWWSAEDHVKFKTLTQRLVREYGRFEPVAGFKVNGELTLGENIADVAGLQIAYKAYRQSIAGRGALSIDGFTDDQRFFLAYAQNWLSKSREELLIEQVKSNAHAPEIYRVNGVVGHLDGFYRAFSVNPSDKMYLPPDERMVLW
jgi:predicted metalloendopeptidase